ncbi:MAG: translation elongation factor Ts [Elusimicrobiota bacterium]|nr:translation elongation factor Ts [Elusimicrobiota bacterium]
MSEITSKQVMSLRGKSGAGIMACKNALKETSGDEEKAIEILRKKGLSGLEKRAGKEMKEGIVTVKTSDDKKTLAILEVNCETDFVARNPEFKAVSDEIIKRMLTDDSMSNPVENEAAKEKLQEFAIKVGENMNIRRGSVYKLDGHNVVNYYVHNDSKKGAVVLFNVEGEGARDESLLSLARDLAMQSVAMNPRWLKREDVSSEIIEKEKEIYKANPTAEGKSEMALEKMLEGRINKFYKENCLLEQPSIRDTKVSISKLVANTAEKINAKVEVAKFDCYIVGVE